MALTERIAPDNLKRTFLDALGADDALQLRFSLPLYSLSVNQLREGSDPLQPKLLGWQFLTFDNQGVALSGEVPGIPDELDGKLEAGLNRGTVTEQAWRAYDAIRQDPSVLAERFELRRLRISALRIEAFWLKMSTADEFLNANDRVFTFVGFQEELNSKLLPASEFLKIVRRLAAKPMAQVAPKTARGPKPEKY